MVIDKHWRNTVANNTRSWLLKQLLRKSTEIFDSKVEIKDVKANSRKYEVDQSDECKVCKAGDRNMDVWSGRHIIDVLLWFVIIYIVMLWFLIQLIFFSFKISCCISTVLERKKFEKDNFISNHWYLNCSGWLVDELNNTYLSNIQTNIKLHFQHSH